MRSTGILLLPLVLLSACAGDLRTIRGTNIESTQDNEQIIDVLERYRQRLQQRDAAGVLALVSPNYHEDSGTPAAEDDYGYEKLKGLIADRMARLRAIRYGLEYRKIHVKQLDKTRRLAEVEVYIDASFQLASGREGGNDRYKRVTEYNKLELENDGRRWLIVHGL